MAYNPGLLVTQGMESSTVTSSNKRVSMLMQGQRPLTTLHYDNQDMPLNDRKRPFITPPYQCPYKILFTPKSSFKDTHLCLHDIFHGQVNLTEVFFLKKHMAYSIIGANFIYYDIIQQIHYKILHVSTLHRYI